MDSGDTACEKANAESEGGEIQKPDDELRVS